MALISTVLRKRSESSPLQLRKEELGLLMGMARTEFPERKGGGDIRLHACAALGRVGSSSAHASHNFLIGTSLLGAVLSGSSSLESVAEALNSLFDVYAEGYPAPFVILISPIFL